MKPKILILGGGIGGLKCVLELQNYLKTNEAEVTLISKHDYHYKTPLLHKVAAGTYDNKKQKIFFREILDSKKITFIKDSIESFDYKNNKVTGILGSYSYDYLIIALGFKPNCYGIKGVEEFSYQLFSLNSALKLMHDIEDKFKKYHLTKDPSQLNFIICGGGFTGIELAGELVERVEMLANIYGVNKNISRITLVTADHRILPMFDIKTSELIQKKITNMGINIIYKHVAECLEDGVLLQDKDNSLEKIESRSVIWTAGVKGNDALEKSEIPNKHGRVAVNSFLSLEEIPNIYVIGDCALAYDENNKPYPPTAQIAHQMGQYAAARLNTIIKQKPDDSKFFKFINRGSICSLGHADAVGVVEGFRFSGKMASFLKSVTEKALK